MPDPVPLKVQHRVTRVFAIPNPMLGGVLNQDGLRLVKQRTYQFDVPIAGRRTTPLHPGEPLAAAAAQEPQEEQLKLIIRVMRQRDAANPPLLRNSCQETMTQFPRSHFQGQLLRTGQLSHLTLLYYDRQLQLLCRPADQPLIRGAAPPTKLMVQMRHSKPPAVPCRQSMQHVQQHHGIHPPGNRRQDALPRPKEPSRADRSVHGFQ
jgi:hypothetical protein